MNYEMLNELQDLIDKMEDLHNRAISGSISFSKSLDEVNEIIDEYNDLDVGEIIHNADSEEEATQAVKLSYRFKALLKKFVD